MIEQDRIDFIKESIDLKTYIEGRDIPLKKNGAGWVGLCPFHDDTNPSFTVNPSTNLWNCFGCGKGGDVIRFVMNFDNLEFLDAVKRLSDNGLKKTTRKPSTEKQPSSKSKPPETRIRQLLERTTSIYEKNLAGIGKEYLEQRGITHAGLMEKHRIGYCTGNLKEILPKGGEILDELNSIGILLDRDYERFNDCLVVPVYDIEGNIVTLYGRHVNEGEKRHLFLPERYKGIWNVGVIKTCSEIIVVESVIDALSVEAAGFANVIAIHGTNLTDRQIMMLKEYGVQKLLLLPDGDDAGIKAGERLKEKLSRFSLTVKQLPDSHDPNSYLVKYGARKLAEFISLTAFEKETEPQSLDYEKKTEKPAQKDNGQTTVQPTADGFTVSYGLRRYEVIHPEKGPRKLKATIRIEHAGKLHVDTLDLYSARSRRTLSQDICRIFDETSESIESDITRLILECEKRPDEPTSPEPSETSVMPEVEKKEAMAFGESPDLIEQILKDFQTCGLIGEKANKLLGYIAMTSRKREEPLSMQILSSSGAGKTALQDTVVSFCPPEDLVKLTSLSGKALFYKDRLSLKYKVLALEEGDGAEEASYAIRNLISSGELVSETTIKDLGTGKLTTMENRVEGPTAVFYTTTNPEVDPETQSRFFVTGIDESREQTRKILAFQRKKHMDDDVTENLKFEAIRKKHRNFQRLLNPLAVKNLYGKRLTYGDDRLQGRRDQPKYLNLIKSVAFLRQMQKDVLCESRQGQSIPYIKVDLEDIRIANYLTGEVLGKSLNELSRPGSDLLMILDEMVEEKVKDKEISRTKIGFTRRNIREYSGWSNARVHRYLKELVELEYVLVTCGKNGVKFRYCLAYEGQGKDGSRFVLGLLEVAELEDEN